MSSTPSDGGRPALRRNVTYRTLPDDVLDLAADGLRRVVALLVVPGDGPSESPEHPDHLDSAEIVSD